MSTYNTQLQSNNTDLQQVLQNLQSTSASIGNEVDAQADLISQIQSMVDNLPEAGSEPTGYCSSVSFNAADSVNLHKAIFWVDGEKRTYRLVDKLNDFVVTNVDIGKPFYITVIDSSYCPILISYSENIEILVEDLEDNILVFKCTSTNSATIHFELDD